MEFLDFLFITIFVLYIIRMVIRMVLPTLFQKVVNKAQQQQQQQYYQQNYNSSPKTGKVKVDYIPKQPKGKIPDSEGDFIDYEEVK